MPVVELAVLAAEQAALAAELVEPAAVPVPVPAVLVTAAELERELAEAAVSPMSSVAAKAPQAHPECATRQPRPPTASFRDAKTIGTRATLEPQSIRDDAHSCSFSENLSSLGLHFFEWHGLQALEAFSFLTRREIGTSLERNQKHARGNGKSAGAFATHDQSLTFDGYGQMKTPSSGGVPI